MPFPIKLKQRREIAEGTMAFHFEKPEGFTFEAGQTLDLYLIDPPETDDEGNVRTFSIASAPHEQDLVFATRMRDTAFKRVLKSAGTGHEVSADGPYGSFTLHKNASKAAVFLAGGIGITPFLSMSSDAAYRKLPHKIYLFYGNRRPEDSAFLEEIYEIEKYNANFKLVASMSEMEKSKHAWEGEKGFITMEMIRKYVTNPETAIYYIAGPPQMVTTLKSMLTKAGIDEDNVRYEEFAGY